MSKPLIIIIDGNALLYRAFHALPSLKTRQSGEPIGAVYGFASMLLKVLIDLKPDHFVIAFDKKGPTFRHHLYDGYKAHRPATPDELIAQLKRLRELVNAFNIPIYELDDYEADDLLGALSKQAAEQCIESIIVTGDADAMQLVCDDTKVLYPKPQASFSDTILYDADMVRERYGVSPARITDLKALVGDTSDNIPGVKGIGNKTALKLINEFGEIEAIYRDIDKVTPPKLQNLLRENESEARQSKVLATIVSDLPVKLDLDKTKVSNYDASKATRLFKEVEFTRLIPRLRELTQVIPGARAAKEEAETTSINYITVDSEELLAKLTERLTEAGSFAFDTETDGLNTLVAGLVGISVSPQVGEAYYIPVAPAAAIDNGQFAFDYSGEREQKLPLPMVKNYLSSVFASQKIAKTAHHAKFDISILLNHGIEVGGFSFDTMIASYLLGNVSNSLKNLAFNRLCIEMTPISELIGSGARQISMAEVEVDKAAPYACADADMTGRLKNLFAKEIEEAGLQRIFSDVEIPLVPVLMEMEINGIALDTNLLKKMSSRIGGQLVGIETAVYDSVGHQFNLNSPKQLGSILFEELKLPPSRRGKSGYSTDARVLEELKEAHSVIPLILKYRQLNKLKTTYIDALPALVNPKSGRLHTSFNQTRTATGRLSSYDPNLQNIPVRGEMGREIREAFIAPDGSLLLSVDYSQIDLRVLAHLSGDEGLCRAFAADEDIHSATATRLFGVETTQVTADMRRLAKTVNFGVIYGMSGYGLEQATELSREEAEKFIKSYFEQYPAVKSYMESVKEQARAKGYVSTMLGKRRYIDDMTSRNRNAREAAERMAINMPVQGGSADIIKVAMVNISAELKKKKLMSKLLLQVHDELILEVPKAELNVIKELVPRLMSEAIELKVPLKADVKIGENWGQLE